MEICMREERRIRTLQKIVERLKVENQQLLTENKRIKEDLIFERNKKKEIEDNQSILEAELHECISEYQKLIEDTQKLKTKYKKEYENLKGFKFEYKKKMNKIIKSIKRDFDVK